MEKSISLPFYFYMSTFPHFYQLGHTYTYCNWSTVHSSAAILRQHQLIDIPILYSSSSQYSDLDQLLMQNRLKQSYMAPRLKSSLQKTRSQLISLDVNEILISKSIRNYFCENDNCLHLIDSTFLGRNHLATSIHRP